MAPTAISDRTVPPPSAKLTINNISTSTKPSTTSQYSEEPLAPPSTLSPSLEKPDTLLQEINHLRHTLQSSSTPLSTRFRALFSLKHHAALQPPDPITTFPALHAIASTLISPEPSPLLKHELAYCLGQTRKAEAVESLVQVLEDRGQDAMVRHESAEALGAIGDTGHEQAESVRRLLRRCWEDESEERVVRETCEIAVGRLEWEAGGKRRSERLRDRFVVYIPRMEVGQVGEAKRKGLTSYFI